jgi:hypothetical protein
MSTKKSDGSLNLMDVIESLSLLSFMEFEDLLIEDYRTYKLLYIFIFDLLDLKELCGSGVIK